MRLKRLDLTRFGKFTDACLDFGDKPPQGPDLHIVYGLNEAGKSTAFAAYMDLLFGIPMKSAYDFLHPYSSMQIGGLLEFDGKAHELIRMKRNSNSLLDANGQPVNEALLAAALGGISRDAYRTMFSLDEDTLKKGGVDIEASKGDLGALLFGASAGLSDIGKVLTTLSGEAEGLYRKRGSTTQLAQLKQKHAALLERRAALDTQASAYAQLVTAEKQAESAHEQVGAELAAARERQALQSRLARAVPLAADLSRLKERLRALAHLPRPARDSVAMLPQRIRDETRLLTRQAGIEDRQRQRQDALDAVAVDDALLALGPRITALEDIRARYRTAEADLPRRQQELSEKNGALRLLLAALGRDAQASAASLLLPAPVTGTLRDLIEQRSGIEAGLKTAARERQRIDSQLEEVSQALAALECPAATVSAALLRRMQAAIDRLQRGDLQARLSVEEREVQKHRAAVARSLSGLLPWQGDSAALESLTLPDRHQFDRWRGEAAELARRLATHRDQIRTLETGLGQARARILLLKEGGSDIDDASARRARSERDGLWQAHRATLDAASAARFEAAMKADDAVTEARLARSGDLAALRQLEQEMTLNEVGLARQDELFREASAEHQALTGLIRSRMPFVPDGADTAPDELIAGLQRWMEGRGDCLSAAHDLHEAEERLAALTRERDADCAALAACLGEAGIPVADQPPAQVLLALAENFLDRVEGAASGRSTLEKRLSDLKAEAGDRERDLRDTEAAATDWQTRWMAALGKTWFGDGASVVEVRALLDTLSGLPALLGECEQQAQRITKMELDQTAFVEEIRALHAGLGLTFDDREARQADERLKQAFDAASRAAEERQRLQQELEGLEDERRALALDRAEHDAAKARLNDAFGVETLERAEAITGDLKERDLLEEKIAETSQSLLAELRAADLDEAGRMVADADPDRTEAELAALADTIDRLTQRAQEHYGALTLARDQLNRVGGDREVAMIESERATVLLEIQDVALRYLRLKTGILAAGSALDLYRERHRSSMMARASDAFRQITRGEYSGLAARPDKTGEVLIGLTREGGSRLSDAMSTGTRYQLYLALRLAGYEEFAAVRPPVPFIADDIMETFDELRSEEVFRLFAAMAGIGQVIYLTHHRHLCDIAETVVPGVRIHQL
nr:AAA family ATPase [uncultured Gellertiella sp.]